MDSVVNLLFYTQVCYLVLLLTSARLVCRSVFYQNKSINFVKLLLYILSVKLLLLFYEKRLENVSCNQGSSTLKIQDSKVTS
jgi:hypothetical protein